MIFPEIAALSTLVLGFASFIVSRLVPDERYPRDWVVGAGWSTLAAVLVALRGTVPDVVSVVLANPLFVLGNGYFFVGTRGLLERPPPAAWHWLVAALLVPLLAWFTFVRPAVGPRIIVVSLAVLPFFAALAWEFWHHGGQAENTHLRLANRLTGLLFAVGVASLVARVALGARSLVDPAVALDVTTGAVVAGPFLYLTMASVWLSMMLTLTVCTRLQHDLCIARDRADAATKAKSQFLAGMSHEIRTPMHAVLGLTQLLEQEPLTRDQAEMVQRIRTAGRTLLGIINDILDFSKIEAGQITTTKHPFTLSAVLQHVDSLIGELARGKGLGLRIDDTSGVSSPLIGDPLRLEQILINLTGNAVKFTERGYIVVRVRPLEASATAVRLRFEIEDTGIGMAAAVVSTLFQPFTQVDGSSTRQFGGTGLGLSISKRLVELLNGAIGVESIPGVGSTFWFELPFERATDEAPTTTTSTATTVTGPRLSGLRLLVADDNQINLTVAARALKKDGAEVTVVTDGQQALDCLRNHPEGYDAVLMDVHMPVMDGLTATRAIRDDLKLHQLPVIALSASVLDEERQRALDAGMNDFLSKPLDLRKMAEVIRQYCSLPGVASGRTRTD